MRFLHSKGAAIALLAGLLAFSWSYTPLFASSNPTAEVGNAEDVDLAKLQAGAEVVFISSGKRGVVSRVIDDDRRTVFEFAESDAHPTLIVKLNGTGPIRRVSLVLGSQTEKVDVYLLNEFPRNASALEKINPIGSIVDAMVAREASIDFAPRNARYVALRWTFSQKPVRTIALAEVSAFGQGGTDPDAITLAAADPPPAEPVDPPVVVILSP